MIGSKNYLIIHKIHNDKNYYLLNLSKLFTKLQKYTLISINDYYETMLLTLSRYYLILRIVDIGGNI